jgi:pimeloyl-ACP methyl ester carboxylesterase
VPTFDRGAIVRASGVPALGPGGEHDRDAPPALMKKIATAIPHSSQQVMKGVGHLQNLEAPDDFDGLLLDFLALPAPRQH